MLRFLVILLFFIPSFLFAKDYQAIFHVKNLPEGTKPVLLRVYNGNLFMLDSTAIVEQGNITFNIPKQTPTCMLRTVWVKPSQFQYGAPPQNVTLDILFNQEDLEFELDFDNPFESLQVIKSKENKLYFDFLRSDAQYLKKVGLIEQIIVNYPEQDEFYKMAQKYYPLFQHQRSKLIDKTYKEHPQTLAGKIIRNQKFPILESHLKPHERDSIFRNNFLQEIDFSDTTLLYTNVYTDKVFQYLQLFMDRSLGPRANEAHCIEALDRLVPLLDINPVIQQHLLQFLIAGFESMKMEEVLAHISSNYIQQCGGSADIIKRRLEGYQKMAVGQKVPDFTVTDITGNPINLYSGIDPYTLVLFWHTSCSHCQILMRELPNLEAQNGLFSKHQIKIIGISIDENKEDWEKFSADYKLDWSNSHIEGGFENPIASDYNLFATPSIFLIDENHQILAKPTTLEELIQNINELK